MLVIDTPSANYPAYILLDKASVRAVVAGSNQTIAGTCGSKYRQSELVFQAEP